MCALLACALALVAAPVALAAPGDVYVADRDAGPAGTGAVIKVDPASGAQQVVASGGSLVDPTGIAVDIRGFPGHDTLLVADPEALGGTGALFRVDPENGNVQVISSGDRFVDPTGVTGFLTVSDPSATPSNPNLGDGDVFFVESGNGVQHPILSGFSLSPSIDLVDPTGLALSASGALLIADPEAAGGAGAVFLLTEPIRTLGSFFSAYAQGGSLSDPTGLAEVPTGVLGHGFIAVADRSAAGTGAVLSLTGGASGGAVQQVLSSGGSFAAPVALAYSPFAGGPLLVADRAAAGGGGALLSVNPASGAQTVLSSGGSFVEPSGVAVSPPLCDGNRADVAGSEGADVIPGSNSSDTVAALGGDDDVDGGESDDLVCAGDGNDEVRGDSGDPLIFGADVLFGEEGDDVLTGNRYPDVLDGGPGDDVLRGRGGGKDRLKCGPGRDKATADRKDRVRGCERVKRSKK